MDRTLIRNDLSRQVRIVIDINKQIFIFKY